MNMNLKISVDVLCKSEYNSSMCFQVIAYNFELDLIVLKRNIYTNFMLAE